MSSTPTSDPHAMRDMDVLPEVGRIDLHSHLLPGIDDGCRTVEESIECVRRLRAQGYVGSLCTPHLGPEWFAGNTPDRIARHASRLRAALEAAGEEYRIWAGGELRLSADTIDWVEEVGIPVLGGGPYVLVDYWGSGWPEYATAACEHLIAEGHRPILAHPERMGFPDAVLDPLLRDLEAMGVLLQGNFNSLGGGEGPDAERQARRLLEEWRYFVMASDMHRPDGLDARLHGLEVLQQLAGGDRVREFLEAAPRAILAPDARLGRSP